MTVNTSNSSNLEQLALNGLISVLAFCEDRFAYVRMVLNKNKRKWGLLPVPDVDLLCTLRHVEVIALAVVRVYAVNGCGGSWRRSAVQRGGS